MLKFKRTKLNGGQCSMDAAAAEQDPNGLADATAHLNAVQPLDPMSIEVQSPLKKYSTSSANEHTARSIDDDIEYSYLLGSSACSESAKSVRSDRSSLGSSGFMDKRCESSEESTSMGESSHSSSSGVVSDESQCPCSNPCAACCSKTTPHYLNLTPHYQTLAQAHPVDKTTATHQFQSQQQMYNRSMNQGSYPCAIKTNRTFPTTLPGHREDSHCKAVIIDMPIEQYTNRTNTRNGLTHSGYAATGTENHNRQKAMVGTKAPSHGGGAYSRPDMCEVTKGRRTSFNKALQCPAEFQLKPGTKSMLYGNSNDSSSGVESSEPGSIPERLRNPYDVLPSQPTQLTLSRNVALPNAQIGTNTSQAPQRSQIQNPPPLPPRKTKPTPPPSVCHKKETSLSSGTTWSDSDIHSSPPFSCSDNDSGVRKPPSYEEALKRLGRKQPQSAIATAPNADHNHIKKKVTFETTHSVTLPQGARTDCFNKSLESIERGSTTSSGDHSHNTQYDSKGAEADNESMSSDQPSQGIVRGYQETDLDAPNWHVKYGNHIYSTVIKQKVQLKNICQSNSSSDSKEAQPAYQKQLINSQPRRKDFALHSRDNSADLSSTDDDAQMTARKQMRGRQRRPVGRDETVNGLFGLRTNNDPITKQISILTKSLDSMPEELLLKVFAYLSSDQLCTCAMVCRKFSALVWSPALWSTVNIQNKLANVDRGLRHITRRLSYNTPTVCLMVEKVNLAGCERLTDKGVNTIADRCPELRYLNIQGCYNVSNIAVFNIVSNCVSLLHLNVSGCEEVTCISLTPTANIQAQTYGKQVDIRYLDMSECTYLDDSGLQMIATYCSKLTRLYLRRCESISDIGVQYMANYCPELQEISICECYKITDFSLKELSKLGPKLKYLSTAKCERITDVGLAFIARTCSKLRYLNIRGCTGITDIGVTEIANQCLRLRSLDIGKSPITDESLYAISEECPKLTKLSLRQCAAISDLGLVSIANGCQNLQHVNIQDCNISVDGYRTVKELFRQCIIEHNNPSFY